jgi:chlorophyllide a reductase subunit Z
LRRLPEADVNICMYREFGRRLCEELDRPYLMAPMGVFATTNFLEKLGETDGSRPEPFIEREKHTTIKPLWDLWRSVTQDFFGHRQLRDRRQRDLCAGARSFLEDEMGVPCAFAFARAGERPTTSRRARRPETPPLSFRHLQRADVPAEAGRAHYIPPASRAR